MSTARQRAANQQNAQKSTGPVTPEGKTISSRNRVSAGFNTTTTYFLTDEKEDQFWQLLEDFTNQYQPATITEQVFLEKMVHNQWLSLRAIRYQRDRLFYREFNAPMPPDLGLLIRYQAAADRAFFKAQAELVKAQKEREKSEIGFVSQPADPAPLAVPDPPAEQHQNTPADPPPAPEIGDTPEIVTAIQKLNLDFPSDPFLESEFLSRAA
jgi:hypothetical protein